MDKREKGQDSVEIWEPIKQPENPAGTPVGMGFANGMNGSDEKAGLVGLNVGLKFSMEAVPAFGNTTLVH